MFDLAIIGAGPAGMAAALAGADHGLSVVVIDEQRRPGGQIFRQPPTEFVGSAVKFSAGYSWGRDLIERCEHDPRIAWRFGHAAYGILRDRETSDDAILVALHGPGGGETLPVRRVLIATGAIDMPVAIPGWTLPGVIMAGAVQSFMKSQRLLVAERLVLAGSHPLLIVVADQLRAAGADIAEVAFARGLPSIREAIGSVGALPGHLGLLAETGVAVARLLKAGVRIRGRTVVTRAIGSQHVEAVELTRVDSRWKPHGARRTVQASALVLGYGFQPSTELARQIGCEMAWNSLKGGWVVAHDATMATSSPGIYVAGEPTGVAGAEQSRADGHLAGLFIARDLDAASPRVTGAEIAASRRAVQHAARFSTVVQRMFHPPRRALIDLATPDTIVCRCELVTKGDITKTLADNPHLSTANAVKLECRSGMGPCQGRYCEGTVQAMVSAAREQSPARAGYFSAHLPVKPVPVSTLATLDDVGH